MINHDNRPLQVRGRAASTLNGRPTKLFLRNSRVSHRDRGPGRSAAYLMQTPPRRSGLGVLRVRETRRTLGPCYRLVAERPRNCDAHRLGSGFGSGGDCSGTTPVEIVAPQSDGEDDNCEPRHNDCPRLGPKPLELLRVELDRAEDCCGGDDPTAIGAPPKLQRRRHDRPADDERDLRYMEVGGAPSFPV